MPLYEYQCQECAETIEVVQRFSDEPQTICPSCGGVLKKLISSPAIRFKGSGFYLTDYGRAGQTKPAAEGSSSTGGDAKSGDSKPAKTESASTPATAASPAKSDKSSSTKSPKSSE